jgi:hypothetical protein
MAVIAEQGSCWLRSAGRKQRERPVRRVLTREREPSFLPSPRFRQSSSVVEQRTHKPLVAGSIPASGTNLTGLVVMHLMGSYFEPRALSPEILRVGRGRRLRIQDHRSQDQASASRRIRF